jgi:hypothetical protein
MIGQTGKIREQKIGGQGGRSPPAGNFALRSQA